MWPKCFHVDITEIWKLNHYFNHGCVQNLLMWPWEYMVWRGIIVPIRAMFYINFFHHIENKDRTKCQPAKHHHTTNNFIVALPLCTYFIGLYCLRQWMWFCSFCSTIGFHHGSIKNTCDAIVEFIATPPTFTFIGNTWKKPTIKVRKFTFIRCGWLRTPFIHDNKCSGALCYNLMDTCDILQF